MNVASVCLEETIKVKVHKKYLRYSISVPVQSSLTENLN